MNGRLPDFVIIGAQRCGTTSLAAWLGTHPGAWMAPEKEVHYFDVQAERGDHWYRERFASAPANRVVGEATPYYLFHPRCAARLVALLPEARLVAILRDPVERAISSYFHAQRHGREPLDLAAALDAETSRLAADEANFLRDEFAYGAHHQWNSYAARGRYAEQLERWLALVPRERLHVLFFEELVDEAAPRQDLARLCAFLGLAPHAVPFPRTHAGENERHSVDSAIVERLRRSFEEDDARLSRLLGRALPWQATRRTREWTAHGVPTR